MGTCHHVDGNCPSGCESGVYGEKCNQPCGNCSNGHLCNEVDGDCQFGCDDGVYGEKCNIGSTIYLFKTLHSKLPLVLSITVKLFDVTLVRWC